MGKGKTVSVNIGQIRCAEWKKSIAGGAKATDASCYFTAIVKKANKGWETLFLALVRAFPEYNFQILYIAHEQMRC